MQGSHNGSSVRSLLSDKAAQGSIGSAQAEVLSPHDDILFPVMNHPFNSLVSYPWERKINKAFMRAAIYEAMAHNCSRVLLHQLAQGKEQHWLGVPGEAMIPSPMAQPR
jgi:hypothetical protein